MRKHTHISSRGDNRQWVNTWQNMINFSFCMHFLSIQKKTVLIYYNYWCYHQQCNLYFFLFKRKINHFAINFSIINFHFWYATFLTMKHDHKIYSSKLLLTLQPHLYLTHICEFIWNLDNRNFPIYFELTWLEMLPLFT